MHEKKPWVGLDPAPAVFQQLDYEEASVLALLAWSRAVRHEVTAADLASLEDRDGQPLGIDEARQITKRLGDLKIANVVGMYNDRALGVFLGGFRTGSHGPRGAGAARSHETASGWPHRGSAATRQREVGAEGKGQGRRPSTYTNIRIETDLYATWRTPRVIIEQARKLKAAQLEAESTDYTGSRAKAAEERLRILRERIDLYKRWLAKEPRHPALKRYLRQKQQAVPELEAQLTNIRAKEREYLERRGIHYLKAS